MEKSETVNAQIDELAERGQKALAEYMMLNQEQIDKIVHAMALAGMEKHMELAYFAVSETGRGVFEDKIIKNIFSTEYIYHSIKDQKTVGIINENEQEGYVEVAEPVGVIAGVTPVTNPTSTTMFKALIAAKTRNPIIFAFHPKSQNCSAEAAKVLRDAAIKAGAPKYAIQWIETPSVDATIALMNHEKIALVLATGGSQMVKSAYSSGKPALGVGSGNVPCYIEKSADVESACTDLMLSKTFDNGMICASEQAVIVDEEISDFFEKFMKENGCVFLSSKEEKLLEKYMFDENGHLVGSVAGMTAFDIAKGAGITVPEKAKILVVPQKKIGREAPLSLEKLSPVLAYYKAKSTEEALSICEKVLDAGGLGHSAVIHSRDDEIISVFSDRMKVGRVIANSPSSQGAIGDIYNTSTPSLTLGCGSYGKNSTTSNISSVNLINKKRLAKRRYNMQWFKIPPKIYFEYDSVAYLEKMPDISRAFIVTDKVMNKLGYADKIIYYLNKRKNDCRIEIFDEVEPDPDVETIMRGLDRMNHFNPDVIIALGGGSVIDAAKGMWLFYEHPETSFDGLKLKFMDIRKRTFSFPKLSEKAQFVAIPTTSGTGSEVTGFSVITDKKNGNIKYPLADYELTPDVAIIDPQFVKSLPQAVVGDTGMDVLTHAIEAYVSVMASDYTNALAIHAIAMVFKYLPRSYKNGGDDFVAREKMHNASAIAGMAFTNAFLGLNHSLAHKLGGEFGIPHGRANAILLPYVIKYNSEIPTKFVSFPKYEKFIADEKYEQIAERLGIAGKTRKESIDNLCLKITQLMDLLGMPKTIKDCGISEQNFLKSLDRLSFNALEDQCTTANPRYPLISEIKDLYKQAYYGDYKSATFEVDDDIKESASPEKSEIKVK